jgi:catechol 2,3-dioxygenase-like lactoylglutathione lyase family enzyme
MMRIEGITIEVSDLARSKEFYENVLGFEPGKYYEPTKWQPFTVDKQYFAIREVDSQKPRDDFDITNFKVDDVEDLWRRVKDSAEVAEELATTPYGTYKFVVKDPDGYRLGFVGSKPDSD